MLFFHRKMKTLLVVALALSVLGNLYLLFRLYVQDNDIDEGVHAELISQKGMRDLSYFLRKSGATRAQLLDWAKAEPTEPGTERLDPQIVGNRFVWFPLEITFESSGAIGQIKVGGEVQ